MNPQTTANIALGIALILIVIGVLALIGHESVVDQGVNAGVSAGAAVDRTRRAAVKGTAQTAARAAEVAA